MFLTPQHDLPFTHPQTITHPPPGHWSTGHQHMVPPLIPTPTPPPFYVSPTPTPTPQHAHQSTYTTCIDCKLPPSYDPDYGLTEAITVSCSHFLCFTCWDGLLLKLNDLDARPAPRPDLPRLPARDDPLPAVRGNRRFSFLLSPILALSAHYHIRPPHFRHFALPALHVAFVTPRLASAILQTTTRYPPRFTTTLAAPIASSFRDRSGGRISVRHRDGPGAASMAHTFP